MSRRIPFERCLAPTFEAPAPKRLPAPRSPRELEEREVAPLKPCGATGCDGIHHHPIKLKPDPFGLGLQVPRRESYCPESEWFKFWKETL